MRGDMMRKYLFIHFTAFIVILFLFFSCTSFKKIDYHHEGLEVTDEVKKFVSSHDISGSDLEKVKAIIELTHDKFIFKKIDRKRIQEWIKDPQKKEDFRAEMKAAEAKLEELKNKRLDTLLTKEEYEKRKELQQQLFFGIHNIKVYEDVFQKKEINPQDLPFVVSGGEAVKYGIRDGCTTFTKTFIVLAKAAGFKEIRFVPTGKVIDYNKACPVKGVDRNTEITINGHFFALVKIEDRWALVNCTYYEPYSMDENIRYEIFFQLDGVDVNPEMLENRILRIPSFQREGIPSPPNKLYVIAVGKDSDDDLNIENYEALMNMSVSGNRDDSICRYGKF